MDDTNPTASTHPPAGTRRLNDRATRIFMALVGGLGVGDAKRLDNAKGAFMAVTVDFLIDGRSPYGAGRWALYAVAHHYTASGDLVPDPDVEFYVVDDSTAPGGKAVYPTAIDHGPLGYHRHVDLDGAGRLARVDSQRQADLARFCDVWMRNIAAQQRLEVR